VSVAEHEKVSLIVVGTHQRRGLRRLLEGSIAEAIIRRAPCPVLAFPQDSSGMLPPDVPADS
jgi:nucleotide-binding universal stress UspA family protein